METISRSLLTFLLNSAWQIPLAAAVAALACRFMRNGPARNRHAVWVAALAVAIALPLASTRSKQQPSTHQFTISLPAPYPDVSTFKPAQHLRASESRAFSPAPGSRIVSLTETTAKLVLAAYCFFIAFRLLGVMRAAFRTAQICRSAQAAALPENVLRVHRRCEEAFGLAGVRLLFSADISAPITLGRAIILPESLLAERSEDLLTTAIGHEMAHIARRDFTCNLLFELLCVPVSFQPALWLIRRGINRTREIACDELVTARLIEARVYARAMMSIAESVTAFPRAGYTLGVFDGDGLEDRMHRLIARRATNLRGSRLLLVAGLSALGVCAFIASALALTARAQGFATGVIKQGQAAYDRRDYQEATQQFAKAVDLDPANLKAKLLLADSLLMKYVPGADASASALAAAAQRQYLDVLAREPGNEQALHGMLSLCTTGKQFSEAHEWALKAIQADAGDKFAYYTAGYVDWQMAWPDYATARGAAGMQPQGSGIIPDAELRQSVRAQHLTQIEDGLHMMNTAVQLDPDYSDAMEYLEHLYGMEAAIVDNDVQFADLTVQAKQWAVQALEAKSRRARNSQPVAQGLGTDGLVSEFVLPPPPAPPPPPPPGWHGTLPPPPLLGEMPPMPEVAKTGASGLVQLSVVIAKDGTVRHIDVIDGPPRLAPPILEGVRKLVFQPTVKDGEPVEVVTMLTFRIDSRGQ